MESHAEQAGLPPTAHKATAITIRACPPRIASR